MSDSTTTAGSATSEGSDSENPVIDTPKPKAHAPRSNQDWWPDQVDVSKLHARGSFIEPVRR